MAVPVTNKVFAGRSFFRERARGAMLLMLCGLWPAPGQTATNPPITSPAAGQAQLAGAPTQTPPASAQAAPLPQGGSIHGSVIAGTPGKAGVPLPGVAITATNTLTGKKYSTVTDIDGAYAMKIPRNGRYVVRVELTGFAVTTQEVVLSGVEAQAATQGIAIVAKPTNFGMELASRAAADEAKQEASTAAGTSRGSGLQSLSLTAGAADTTDVTAAAGNTGAAMPSLAGLGDSSAATESVAVSGQQGQMNGLAGISEDDLRDRVQSAVDRARESGMLPGGGDPTNAIVGMLGGMMGGGGRGGFGGGGGGRRGGGGGAFRNFNPAQPHGSIFYQGGNSALNSAPWSPTLVPETNPSSYSNRFGVTLAGSPYIPGLTKPNTKQFVFINFTGQKNLNAFLPSPVRVPTDEERAGDFANSFQLVNGAVKPVQLYDPSTGNPIPGNNLDNAATPLSAAAEAIVANYYPRCNINCAAAASDPTLYNYQTISNAGSNNVALNTRYVRNFGQGTNTPFGMFGGNPAKHGGDSNLPASLKQNINLGYNYSHSASDLRNIFLPLGGATESDGNGLNAGYTIGYGRLSNNLSVNWNRLSSQTRNYFTNTPNDPTTASGIAVPNQTGGFANPLFYNGLPTIAITNFATISNQTPNDIINQTISFSDFVAYRHKKHNMRFGFDIRRVHADSVGGNNPLGQFSFTGFVTDNPADKAAGSIAPTGSGFADFLLGLPTSTKIQAGLFKIYLRENVDDAYVQDDFRVTSSLTLNSGLRYEYFAPYTEKNDRLVNLEHDPSFNAASIKPIVPGTPGLPTSLVNPDRTMFAPRFGFAYRPKNAGFTKDTVVRGGYGVNYNTGQYASFARSLSFQPPFAQTQTNDLAVPSPKNLSPTPTGCTIANLTLADGFGTGTNSTGCSTQEAVHNNYAVNPNYRLGMVQAYNLNIQRILPLQIVLNIGYNGSKGSNLDVLGSPNSTPAGVSTPNVAPFDYETSVAGSHSNQLVVSAQKRQQKGIALGVTYTYSHSIDNASSLGGTSATTVQNFYRLDLEEANSSFDQRQNLSGNWVLELPFGPNRAYFNKGGFFSHALDGFSLSGTFTFATGSYFTPQYQASASEASSGNDFTQRPDRVFTQPIEGAGKRLSYFNPAAFAAPANGFGTASRDSIEGPGTVSVNTSLSRTVQLGETRSFEARVTASNVFNTVQYNGINTTENSANFGQVTSAAAMRALQVQARYRF